MFVLWITWNLRRIYVRKFIEKAGLVAVASGSIALLAIGSAAAGINGGGRALTGMVALALARAGISF